MTREELIAQCKYYKGEKRNPFLDKDYKPLDGYFPWEQEYTWVEFNLNNRKDDLDKLVKELTERGLADFPKGTTIPVSLRAMMFALMNKERVDTEQFKEYLTQSY